MSIHFCAYIWTLHPTEGVLQEKVPWTVGSLFLDGIGWGWAVHSWAHTLLAPCLAQSGPLSVVFILNAALKSQSTLLIHLQMLRSQTWKEKATVSWQRHRYTDRDAVGCWEGHRRNETTSQVLCKWGNLKLFFFLFLKWSVDLTSIRSS